MNIMPSIQDSVQRLLKRRRMTMADLAAKTGRSFSDVRRSLREPHWWRLDRFLEYADALGVPPHRIFPETLRRNSRITGTPEIERSRDVAGRMSAAIHAAAAVRWLNEAGARSRRKSR